MTHQPSAKRKMEDRKAGMRRLTSNNCYEDLKEENFGPPSKRSSDLSKLSSSITEEELPYPYNKLPDDRSHTLKL